MPACALADAAAAAAAASTFADVPDPTVDAPPDDSAGAPAAAIPAAPARLARALVLHGYLQSAAHFAARAAPLRRRLAAAGIDAVFLDAPHAVAPPADAPPGRDARAWWSAVTDGDGAVTYTGWPASRAALAEEWARAPPGTVTGLLGFSQGAVAVHHLLEELAAARAAPGDADDAPAAARRAALAPLLRAPPAFAVLLSGFAARERARPAGAAPLDVPSLHVFSADDAIVAPAASAALAARFARAETLEHPHGHAPPQRAGDVRRVAAFCVDAAARAAAERAAAASDA